MAIEAVDAHVQLAADEPLRVRRIPLEHAVPMPRPLELFREVRSNVTKVAVLSVRFDPSAELRKNFQDLIDRGGFEPRA